MKASANNGAMKAKTMLKGENIINNENENIEESESENNNGEWQ
jgi:hypothetical protein